MPSFERCERRGTFRRDSQVSRTVLHPRPTWEFWEGEEISPVMKIQSIGGTVLEMECDGQRFHGDLNPVLFNYTIVRSQVRVSELTF